VPSYSELVQIEGMAFIYCAKCGTRIPIPPRTTENLEQIQQAQRIGEQAGTTPPANPQSEENIRFSRTMLCPSCRHVMVCRDRHTRVVTRRPEKA
jgi:DNA-directed RNA polymerase subunit RPC12/RpoP